jgi:2-phospho-L-lactate guanylyltransferase
MTGAPRIWAVVPVKAPAAAKQRLAPLLEDIERERLARAMAEDVLGACMAARALAGTVVVTADDGVARLAEAAGASIVREIGERGTNAAIQAGIGAALRVATGVVVVPADIPHVTAASLDTVAGLCSGESALVLVPASRDGGTNLFACAPPDLVETSFGPGSFARHLEGAARAGLRPLLPSLGWLDLDLDRPEDIAAFLDLPTQTRTRRVLLDLGVPARLRSIFAIRREAGRASPADTNMVL